MTSISPPANNVDQSVPVARNPNMPGSSSMNNFLIPSSPLLNSKNSSNCKMQKPIAEIGFHESPRLLPSSGVNGHFGSAQLNTTHDSPSSKRAAGLSLNFPPSPYNTSPRSPNVPPRRFQTGSEQHNSFSPAHQNSRFNAMSHDRKKGGVLSVFSLHKCCCEFCGNETFFFILTTFLIMQHMFKA